VRDLVVEGEEREILWKSLKERAEKNGEYNLPEDNLEKMEIDFLKILLEWDKIKEDN
jgi:hypothetical protein